jgi:hypothetical protein
MKVVLKKITSNCVHEMTPIEVSLIFTDNILLGGNNLCLFALYHFIKE